MGMGTVKESKIADFVKVRDPTPAPFKIWDLDVDHRCIAGYADLKDLKEFIETTGKTRHELDPLIVVFVAVFVATFVLFFVSLCTKEVHEMETKIEFTTEEDWKDYAHRKRKLLPLRW